MLSLWARTLMSMFLSLDCYRLRYLILGKLSLTWCHLLILIDLYYTILIRAKTKALIGVRTHMPMFLSLERYRLRYLILGEAIADLVSSIDSD